MSQRCKQIQKKVWFLLELHFLKLQLIQASLYNRHYQLCGRWLPTSGCTWIFRLSHTVLFSSPETRSFGRTTRFTYLETFCEGIFTLSIAFFGYITFNADAISVPVFNGKSWPHKLIKYFQFESRSSNSSAQLKSA